MSLVFAGITPHTPLLLPSVSKDKLALIEKTQKAMSVLENEFYAAQPDTVVVLTPHGNGLPDALTLDLAPQYQTNFEEFGDLVTKTSWKPDSLLIHAIREDFKEKHLPLVLASSEALDYGASIPVHLLTPRLPQAKLVPITTSEFGLKTHYDLGRELKEAVMSSTSRVAVIASADLSHRSGSESPSGMSPRGAAYDDRVIELLRAQSRLGILDIDDAWITEAQTCSARVLAMFFGIIDDVQHKTEIISYEKTVGIGYVVANLHLS